ncbi:recombinase family protein, partial [Candidatus Bipolaricaulota bacterium]
MVDILKEIIMMKKVVSYIRVSTEEQAVHGHSLDSQRKLLAEFANRSQLLIQKEFEEVCSAYHEGRAVFQELCRYLRAHPEVEAVLVYKIDRMTRNLSDYALLTEQLARPIISATEDLPDNSLGRAMRGMQVVMSRQYSDQLSERVKLGLQTKADKGIYPGPAPDGYANENGRIILFEERARIIRELFDVFLTPDKNLSALAKYANDRGFRTRRGKKFGVSTLRYILTNPVYRGSFTWNEKTYDGVHEPLVNKVVFGRVQAKLDRKPKARTRHVFPFRGLLTCARCGCKITASLRKGKYIHYNCTGGRGKCDVQKVVRQEELAERLRTIVGAVTLSHEQVEFFLELHKKSRRGTQFQAKLEIETLENEMAAIREERLQAFSSKLQGQVTDEFWAEFDTELETRLNAASTRIKMVRRDMGGVLRDPIATLELLERATALYDRASASSKAKLLEALVLNCEMDRENVYPDYRKPFSSVALALKSPDPPSGLLSNCGMSSRVVPSGTPQRQLWNSSLAES